MSSNQRNHDEQQPAQSAGMRMLEAIKFYVSKAFDFRIAPLKTQRDETFGRSKPRSIGNRAVIRICAQWAQFSKLVLFWIYCQW